MGTYVPSTEKERREMLASIGVCDMDDLFRTIPEDVMLKEPLDIPKGMSELEVRKKMKGLANKNKVYSSIFRGCGSYNHYIPSCVGYIASKEEFLTTYTPYQAEISQGILQAMFEYQTMICELTGMELSNASVYDGATAASEAILMCLERKKNKAVVSGALHPDVLETIKTYFSGSDVEICFVPCVDGKMDYDKMKECIDDSTACVVVGQISFYGQLEDIDKVKEVIGDVPLVMYVNPIALGMLKTPGEYGAQIAVGEGQSLGIPMSFGGPCLGFMACTKEYMRKIPGRIVGKTTDSRGRTAYVLTLQAREQHIRREKARSNICTNQANCALRAAIYMSAMGKEGIKKAALLSMSKAHYLKDVLLATGLFELVYQGEFFNEFVTRSKDMDDRKMLDFLSEKGILGGYPYEGNIIWCATEMNSKEEMDYLVSQIKEVAGCS